MSPRIPSEHKRSKVRQLRVSEFPPLACLIVIVRFRSAAPGHSGDLVARFLSLFVQLPDPCWQR